MPPVFVLTLCFLTWIPAFYCAVTTQDEFSVLEGGSLTIPCHYEPQYTSYVKYWCKGKTREFCTSLSRTDEPRVINPAEDKVSIFDDPIQQVFTVTMNDLEDTDSGWYWCGVEIGGVWSADDAAYTHIKVVNGMSVVNSRVSGEVGDSVTVKCLYSKKYRESEKKWCRSGDWSSCLLTGAEGSNQHTSVAISDDRTGAFTVTLKKLQMRDSGWYWCSAGQQKIAVHVLVTPRITTTVTSPTTQSQPVEHLAPQRSITSAWDYRSPIWMSMMVCASLFILLGLVVLGKRLWKVHMQDSVQRKMNAMSVAYNEYADVDDMQSAVIILSKDSKNMH